MAARVNGDDRDKDSDDAGAEGWRELPTDPAEVSDAMLADALGDADVRALVEAHRKASGETADLDSLDPLRQKALLLEVLHMVADLDTAEILDITDELVAEIVADPEAQPLLEEAVQEMGLQGPPQALSMDDQRALIVALVESGAIDLGYDDDDDFEDDDEDL